ncbi:B12-binding domain-containing radical SAM protein [bacterium]|nr:B12-binding domain-containing radical SAM protein [bacterium]
MRVDLVRPNLTKYMFSSIAPLGLGYMARTVRNAGYEARIRDVGHGDLTRESYYDDIRRRPPDIVGFSSYSRDFAQTMQLVDEMGSFLPRGVPFVIGGPHPSAIPEETLRLAPRLDYVISGEGEEALPLLMKAHSRANGVRLEDIPGLAWRDGETIRVNDRVFPQNLDAFGHIDWDELDPRSYHGENLAGGSRRAPAAIVISSRGCPFHCEFCTDHILFGAKTRRHSVDYVMEDIEILHRKFGFSEIRFVDDNFPTERGYVRAFVEEFKRRNWDLIVSMPIGIHLQLIDEELLDLLKSIGMYEITVGIEAGSRRVQKFMRKGVTTELVREKVGLIRRKGFDTIGLFILGYPTETKAEMNETIRLSLELGLDQAHFHPFMPFPGTPITRRLEEWGQLQTIPWDQHHFEKFNFSYCELPVWRLQLLRLKAMSLFYLRPRQFFRFVTKFKTFGQFKFIFTKVLEYM